MEENNKIVAKNRQIGLYLGHFEYSKSGKDVRVVELLVWSNKDSVALVNPQIIRIWDYKGNVSVSPFDTVYVSYEYVEGYKGVFKKYLDFEKYNKEESVK